MPDPRTLTAIRDVLADALRNDIATVVVGETVARGGIASSCEGLLDEFGPQRVVEVPVADRAAMGLA